MRRTRSYTSRLMAELQRGQWHSRSIGIVAFCYLGARDLRWLWMVNLMIALHYFTDHFDGKLGKFRDTGLCKWGFYMDHLFDYGFLCAILIGYTLLIPERAFFNMLLVLCVFSAFMFHTYLMLATTEEFKVSFSRFQLPATIASPSPRRLLPIMDPVIWPFTTSACPAGRGR